MKKLSQNFLEICTPENCCVNELVALPQGGDAGFDEYFEHKSEEIRHVKKLFSSPEQTKLMLAYPKPDAKEAFVFEKFFESPSIVAKKQEFEGCFAVDISDYIGKTEDEAFEKLVAYIHNNKNTVFLLFFYSDNKNEIQNMYEAISRYDELRMISIPLPDARTLTDYTVSGIRDFTLHIKKPVQDYLQNYYSKAKCGYDLADYLVRYLKSINYSGDLPEMKEATKKIDKMWHLTGAGADFGY